MPPSHGSRRLADTAKWLWLAQAVAVIIGVALVMTVGVKVGGLAAAIVVGLMVLRANVSRWTQRGRLDPLRELLDVQSVEAETSLLSGSTELSGHISGQPARFVIEQRERGSEFRIAIPCDVPAFFYASGPGWAKSQAPGFEFETGDWELDDEFGFTCWWEPRFTAERNRLATWLRRPSARQALASLLHDYEVTRVGVDVPTDRLFWYREPEKYDLENRSLGEPGTALVVLQAVYSPYRGEHISVSNVRGVLEGLHALRASLPHWS